MHELAGKKLLLVITKSNWGGAQEYVYTLARRFKEAGAEVVVALGGTGDPGAGAGLLETRLAEAGIRTIFIKSFMWRMGFLREFQAFFELMGVLGREKPDIVHLNSSKAGGIGALAGRLRGVKRIIFTAHGWAHLEAISPLARMLRWWLSWLTIILAHSVIALCEQDVRNAPVFFSRKKFRVIYNGISPFPLQARAVARDQVMERARGAAAFPFWYLAMGELHPNKGFDVLIRAFSELSDAPDAALIIVGKRNKKEALELLAESSRARDRVFFTDFIPNARELLAAADVFVLSSRKEGFPFVILEAALARLPVIATRVGALPEIIEDEVSGLLVPRESIGLLTGAMERMKTDEALRTRSGLALHARAVRDFSEEKMLLETVGAYHLKTSGT